jgi:TonB family protein
MLRRALVAIILTVAASAAAFGQTNVEEARRELNEGARAYRDGRFAEAEQRFRHALELDPEGRNTRLFIARAVQQQYRPGDTTPENVAVAERAIAAYAELLGDERNGDDAYKATFFLYNQLKRDDKVVEMLTQRANDPSVSNDKRAEAFVILASRQWQCSYNITEQKENKRVEQRPDKLIIHYKRPASRAAFVAARRCADEGLRLSDMALTLAPEHVNGWSYKANLLREEAKLSEMEGDAAQRAEYQRRYEEALETQKRLAQEAARKREAEEPGDITAVTEPSAPPKPGAKRVVVSGGVLNSKAISKPKPEYPANAMAAGAQGVVTVQILVDEEGRVAEAVAVSGHPLLREAAVTAARNCRFAPTRLSGQPVKVSGVVTYNFVLQW